MPPETAPRMPPPSTTSATRAPGGRSRSAVATGCVMTAAPARPRRWIRGEGRARLAPPDRPRRLGRAVAAAAGRPHHDDVALRELAAGLRRELLVVEQVLAA